MTVTQLADHRHRPRTPITVLDTMTDPDSGRPTTSEAVSTNGTWSYRWLSDEITWEVEHNPTSLTERFYALNEMLEWTGDEQAALDDLRRLAIAQVEADFVLPSEQRRAHRALMFFAGTLLPRTTDPAEIESMCVCGGYLAYTPGLVPGQTLTHVDTCAECLHNPAEPCPDDRNTHLVCDDPRAKRCGHDRCTDVNRVHARCLVGKDDCCGMCCHGGVR